MWLAICFAYVLNAHTIRCVHVSMFAQTTHCVQVSYRGFGGDDMDLLDLMLVNISPGAISFTIKCMMEGGWSILWA